MHIPDGFINAGASLGAGAAAFGGLTLATKRAGKHLEDRHIPTAGLVAAFLFAVQMLNFPVAAGTSGHLLGGVLATVLVGPWMGVMAVAIVVMVQTLFADGGITAVGLNIVNLSLVGALGGYAVFLVARRALPASRSGIALASGVASGVSVVMAAGAFVIEYWIGGTGSVSARAVGGAVLGVHVLIGIAEGLITASTVGAVLAVRPDLVHGAAGRTATGARLDRAEERAAA